MCSPGHLFMAFVGVVTHIFLLHLNQSSSKSDSVGLAFDFVAGWFSGGG